VLRGFSVLEAEQLRSSDPQAAIAILCNGMDREQREQIAVVHTVQSVTVQDKQAVIRSNPDLPLPIFKECAEEIVRETLVARECVKDSVAVAEQSSPFHPHPKALVAGHEKAEDTVLVKGGSVIAVKEDEALAIKSQQTTGGSNP